MSIFFSRVAYLGRYPVIVGGMATHPPVPLTRAAVDIVSELSLSDGDSISVQVLGAAGAHYAEGGSSAPASPDAGHMQPAGQWAYFTVGSDPIWYWTTADVADIVVSSN